MDANGDAPSVDTPSPFVMPSHLKTLVNKSVTVAGKVTAVNDRTITLDTSDGNLTIHRPQPPTVPVDPNCFLLVRGLVKPDLSVVESTTCLPTVLGDNFDMNLFNRAAAVTTNMQFVHMFN